MKMQPTDFGNKCFNVNHLYETPLRMEHGEAVFEIELRMRHLDQRLFIGMLDGGSAEDHRGIGISIDPRNGEVFDAINGQGIIGYLDAAPAEVNLSTFLCLEFEKIKRIFIPKLTVGEEKILHPALHLPGFHEMSLVVGTTATDGGAVFENPHLMVTSRPIGSSTL